MTSYSMSCSRGWTIVGGDGRVGGRDEVLLRRHLRAGRQVHPPLGEAQADAHEEALVAVLVHEHVGRGRRADLVAPHLEGAHGVVRPHVEERVVARPRRAVGRLGDDVSEVGVGAQVADAHRVLLGAIVVGGVEEQVLAGREVVHAEREVVAVAGQRVQVEQHLLARHGLVLRQPSRRLDVGAAQDRVLLPLLRAAVEPATVLAERHREVGLLDPGLDLLEQGRLQVLGVGERLAHERVLGGQEVEDLGVAAIIAPQPVPVVDALVAVLGDDVGATGRGGGRERHGVRAYGVRRGSRYGRHHVC